jgi:hypothetical protein
MLRIPGVILSDMTCSHAKQGRVGDENQARKGAKDEELKDILSA